MVMLGSSAGRWPLPRGITCGQIPKGKDASDSRYSIAVIAGSLESSAKQHSEACMCHNAPVAPSMMWRFALTRITASCVCSSVHCAYSFHSFPVLLECGFAVCS